MIEYHWSKFQLNLSILVEVRAPKPPKMDHFIDVPSPPKHLIFYNFGTTDKTYLDYVSSLDLSFGVKIGAQLIGCKRA